MYQTGLVSVSFRSLSPEAIVQMVKKAGLDGIEWGGDIHVPAGDIETAKQVRILTEEAELQVLAYGSYYYLGENADPKTEFQKVIDCAQALGAPVIRIWGGKKVSAALLPQERAAMIAETQLLCDMLSGTPIKLAFEFHNNTITDTAQSAVRLMEEVSRDNVYLYYQPNRHNVPEGTLDVDFCATELKLVLPWLYHIHAYHFNNKNEKRPLSEGISNFKTYMKLVKEAGKNPAVMIEFCLDNSVENFEKDAAALKEIVSF